MNRAGKWKQDIVAILLIGMIMGMAFSGMYLSKSWSFEAFYDVGSVYEEVTFGHYQGTGIWYNNIEKQVEVREVEASQYWALPLDLEDYNYFILELAHISQENPEVIFQFYAGENLVEESSMQLQEGKNILEIRDKTATILYMKLYQKQGLSYQVKTVEYRENLPMWNSRTFFVVSLSGFICCITILFIFRWILKRKEMKFSVAVAQENIQKVFIKVADKVNRNPFLPRMVRFWRKTLFFFLISFMNYGERTGVSRKALSRNIKIYCIIMLVIAVISLEKQRKVRNWNHPLAISWFWLVGCMAISFFIVPKRSNLGMIYLVIFGFFFFVWGNMEKPEEMLHDLCAVIKWEFWLCMGYSCLFFPEQTGYAYQGVFRNPNILAIYTLVPSCVFLAELLDERKGKIFNYKKCISALGFGLSTCVIWKTQCRSVSGGLLLVILVSGYILLRKKNFIRAGKMKWQTLALMVAIVAGVFLGHAGLNAFPEKSSLEQVSRDEIPKRQGDIFTLTAEAAGSYNNKFIQKFFSSKSLDEFASGRITFWKAYLRQMNFFGHEFKAQINERRDDAHNGFLSIAYQYGVLSLVPYLFYLFYYVLYGYRYFRCYRGEKKYAVFPLLLMLFTFPFLLLDNLESPFHYEAWFTVYLTTGILFEEKAEWKKE